MSVYRVLGGASGLLAYAGYQPGQVFTATLEPAVERRGIARRNIELLDSSKPTLQPGSYKRGWLIPERGV